MIGRTDLSGNGRLLTDVIGIGVLTRVFHRDLVDTVLAETKTTEQRKRLLPARVVVYLVLALTLYASEAYEEVTRRLVHGLTTLHGWRAEWQIPTDGAISRARTRLGAAPMRELFNRAAVPVARPGTPSAFIAGRRVVAIDGVVLDVPDTAENAAEFGYSGKEDVNRSAFPQVRMATLSEVGTHATIGAAMGPVRTDERTLAEEVIDTYLRTGMLLVADRGFYSYELWARAVVTGADLLWLVSDTLELPVRQYLPDGSFLSEVLPPEVKQSIKRTGKTVLGDDVRIPVRVIEYMIKGRGEDNVTIRLVTTIIDYTQAPAEKLAAVYAERWEHELVFDEIETHQMHPSKVLRSRTPELVKQEIWAYLLTHYAIRVFMAEAAEDLGEDPDRISFIRSIRVIRRQVDDQAGLSPLRP
ncbi:MAG: IS4 family transposase [Dermatophilaceae bacterium]